MNRKSMIRDLEDGMGLKMTTAPIPSVKSRMKEYAKEIEFMMDEIEVLKKLIDRK